MSRIQSSIGLITGIPILDTVDQLIAVSARPRDLLLQRNAGLQAEQVAYARLTSLVVGVQFEINKLASSDLFNTKSVTSADPDLISATLVEGTQPPIGTYQFTPVQTASSHQFLSTEFGPDTTPQNVSGFTFRTGGFLDRDLRLADLNAGDGVQRGKIRVTDRSGASAEIDLRFAVNVSDVIAAINENSSINVTAEAAGDAIKLVDNTGQSTSNLSVQEVGNSTTAADLGLDGINVAANEATGSDLVSLSRDTLLADLNDGTGVYLIDELNDLEFTLADGTEYSLDLGSASTLGDVLDALNAVDPAKLTAAIAADGDGLDVTDLTSGSGTFAITSSIGGTAARDLGLTATANGSLISGERLLAGLQSSLVKGLNGGTVTELGSIELTDRTGVSAIVNLGSAETITDVLSAINGAGIDIVASLNTARNGILLTDTSGDVGDISVVSTDATNSAELLGIAGVVAADSVNGSPLNLQTVSKATLLASLNGGQGIDLGAFEIIDADGNNNVVQLDLDGATATTVGDVIDAINALSNVGVTARINDTGDGILVENTANGTGTLSIVERANGSTAADLGILGTATTVYENNTPVQVLDGSAIQTVDVAREIGLNSLAGGEGIELGKFQITRRQGGTNESVVIDLSSTDDEAVTLGDVIDRINNNGELDIGARINDAGDGLVLFDTEGNAESITVTEIGTDTTAADLGLLGTSNSINVSGLTTQAIVGAGTFDTTSIDEAALTRIADKINSSNLGVTAGTIFDGTNHRLSFGSVSAGAANELLVDTASAGFGFTEVSRAQDALLVLGTTNSASGGILLTGNQNRFEDVIAGVTLSVEGSSADPVEIKIASTDEELVETAQSFVDAYNSVRDNIDSVTEFNETDLTTAILFGSASVLRVETDLSRLATDRYRGIGQFESLQEIGIDVDDQGRLSLDTDRFQSAFAENRADLEQFFTDESSGVVAKFEATLEQLAGEGSSVLTTRSDSLTDKIETNNERIDLLGIRLESERQVLLKQFFLMEEIIGRLQNSSSILQSLAAIPPL